MLIGLRDLEAIGDLNKSHDGWEKKAQVEWDEQWELRKQIFSKEAFQIFNYEWNKKVEKSENKDFFFNGKN